MAIIIEMDKVEKIETAIRHRGNFVIRLVCHGGTLELLIPFITSKEALDKAAHNVKKLHEIISRVLAGTDRERLG